MNAKRAWVGLMFLAMGVIGVLSVSGVLNGERVLGEWWPVAIVGWPLADAISEGRFTIDGAIVAAVGLTLLADEQGWAAEGLMWSGLFLFIGGSILLAPATRRRLETRHPVGEGSTL